MYSNLSDINDSYRGLPIDQFRLKAWCR